MCFVPLAVLSSDAKAPINLQPIRAINDISTTHATTAHISVNCLHLIDRTTDGDLLMVDWTTQAGPVCTQ